MALLEVENLEIAVSTQRNLLPVVQGVSFTVDENETLGIAVSYTHLTLPTKA